MIIQIFINALFSATLLSLVAVGFNLIFNVTRVFHMAHGALFVCPVFIMYHTNQLHEKFLPGPLSFILSLLFSLLLLSGIAFLIEKLLYWPLFRKNSSGPISLITSLGVYFLLVNLITLIYGSQAVSINKDYRIVLSGNHVKVTLTELTAFIIGSLLLMGIFLAKKSRYYLQWRAISENYNIAEKYGIDIRRMRMLVLLAGTLLAGIAGIMRGTQVAIEPNAGLSIVLIASVAVIAGGVSSLKGTVIACFMIAFIQNFSILVFPAEWTETITYSCMILALFFFRKGLIAVNQRIETT